MSKSVKLGVITLAIMNVTAVVSLRGLPAEAEYGISSAFYYLFAAIVFLIPTSFVAAELAAMFQDKQGGVFRWVGEAFGKRMGFLAIWLQWVESTIWYKGHFFLFFLKYFGFSFRSKTRMNFFGASPVMVNPSTTS